MLLSPNLEQFINKLPDSNNAKVFLERLVEEQPEIANRYAKNEELLANLCTLAAYSYLLSETLLQRPEYISWLARERERDLTKRKEKDVLLQDLARFVAVNSSLSDATQLNRFKRRELLRIYLRDCLKLGSLSDTTAELSFLADSVLARALQVCYQPLLSRYGKPQTLDERGRFIAAEFAIIGMGKLGSYELNYSSDIDLIFIYSADGETVGGREVVSNKYFFTKLAEALVKTISSPLGEGAVFRIDLRLRPRGREGDLVVSLAEMVRYYQKEAQNWERQALVRARASAGDEVLVEKLLTILQDQIYQPEPLIDALRSVKLTKEKIDHDVAKRSGGYNVKLGKGGIREIEFIVQALQICYGGKEAWLRAPQTLIGLKRLADKNLISDSENTQLSQAYIFLRTVEHRLQMEHGLQTHTLPSNAEKLLLLAKRLGYETYTDFDQVLQLHCQNVQSTYNRVFGQTEIKDVNKFSALTASALNISKVTQKNLVSPIANIESLFQEALLEFSSLPNLKLSQTEVAEAISTALHRSINSARALRRLRDFALSASSESERFSAEYFTKEQIQELTLIASNSQYFIQMLISHPNLTKLLGEPLVKIESKTKQYFYQQLFNEQANLSLEAASLKLRIHWHEEIVKLGRLDLLAPQNNQTEALKKLREINLAQTALAEACLQIATELACEHLFTRYSKTDNPLTYAVLGLGRLGHCGIDYNSDLDIVFVYSDKSGKVVEEISNQEFFAKAVELIIQILSALKREGMLYRIDMRLRPDGRNGLLAISFDKLQNYIKEHAAIWELLAYLKARVVAQNTPGQSTPGQFQFIQTEFAQAVEEGLLQAIFSRSQTLSENLRKEIQEIRLRLENEKGRATDFKFGQGGMLDVYFATRYLQLKHQIPDPPTRGTLSLISYLAEKNVITLYQANILTEGYRFLRLLDHQIRLQLERPQTTLPHSSAQRKEIAQQMGYLEESDFLDIYQKQLSNIRQVYKESIER
jgi:glutamate-ammonia-ligase adenylyltransferase